MALNWDWNKKIGEAVIYNYDGDYTYSLYQGNAFLIILWEYKDENGKDMWQMSNFFADKEHAKNCLGLSKDYEGENIYNTGYYKLKKIRINKAKYKYTKDLVDMLIKAFDEIEIELYTEKEEKGE